MVSDGFRTKGCRRLMGIDVLPPQEIRDTTTTRAWRTQTMKFVCLAAAAAATLFALPAAAADLRVSRTPSPVVRIAIAGKTDAQMTSEIKAAAATVCGADAGSCVQ